MKKTHFTCIDTKNVSIDILKNQYRDKSIAILGIELYIVINYHSISLKPNTNYDYTAVQIHLQQALLSASFDVFGQLWTTFDNFWQLWTTLDIFWHFLAFFDIFWQCLATFGNFWRLLAFLRRQKTSKNNCWHKDVQNCPKLSKVVKSCPKTSKDVQRRQKSPKNAKRCQKF